MMFLKTVLQNLTTSLTGNRSWKIMDGQRSGPIMGLHVISCCVKMQNQKRLRERSYGSLINITRNKPLTTTSGLVLNVMVTFTCTPTLTRTGISLGEGSSMCGCSVSLPYSSY